MGYRSGSDARRHAAWIAAGIALLALVPVELVARAPSVCLFQHLTGLPCPGCGLTRSLVATAHLRLDQAFEFHAFGPPLMALALGWAGLAALGRLPARWPTAAVPMLGAGAVAWFGWAVARAI